MIQAKIKPAENCAKSDRMAQRKCHAQRDWRSVTNFLRMKFCERFMVKSATVR